MNQQLKKVAAVQLVSCADIDENLARAEHWINIAVSQQAQCVVLPENFATFGMANQLLHESDQSISQRITRFLQEQSQRHNIILVGGSFPYKQHSQQEKFLARSMLFNEFGVLLGCYDKLHLFDAQVGNVDDKEVYRESDCYIAGHQIVCSDTSLTKIAVAICYDLRFPELFRLFFQRKASLIALPSAFTQITGEAHWLPLLKARAIENASYIVAANQGGQHANGRSTFGHSCIISPWGEVLDVCETGEGIAIAEFSTQLLSDVRRRLPVHKHQRIKIKDTF